ncbi:MAG: hypothetical protein PGN08_06080 [Sphingomonas taxi]
MARSPTLLLAGLGDRARVIQHGVSIGRGGGDRRPRPRIASRAPARASACPSWRWG